MELKTHEWWGKHLKEKEDKIAAQDAEIKGLREQLDTINKMAGEPTPDVTTGTTTDSPDGVTR